MFEHDEDDFGDDLTIMEMADEDDRQRSQCQEESSTRDRSCSHSTWSSHTLPQADTLCEQKPQKNKWISFFLCLFFGAFGAHKFYEGKILMGILYLFTGGFSVIGILCNLFLLLLKPNP